MAPKDPVMLLSYVNTKLRDFYGSLDELAEEEELSKDDILDKLSKIGYSYNREENRFEWSVHG